MNELVLDIAFHNVGVMDDILVITFHTLHNSSFDQSVGIRDLEPVVHTAEFIVYLSLSVFDKSVYIVNGSVDLDRNLRKVGVGTISGI